jgi:small ligand-binding sensory domain FIST
MPLSPERRTAADIAQPVARIGVATRDDPYNAIDEVLAAVEGIGEIDLALLFVNARLARFLPAIVSRVNEALHPRALAGCTASAVFGSGSDRAQGPAISLLALRLPGAKITTMRLGEWLRDAEDDPERWRAALDLPVEDINGMLLLADPFRTDAQSLLSGLHYAYPHAAITGGVALGSIQHRQTWVVAGDEIAGEGAVAVAIGGDYTIVPVLSQGCTPIGQTWTITGTGKQWIDTIAGRPAMDVLLDTLRTIPADQRDRAGRNLFAGLAADEYRDEFMRGDFLIRGIAGVERESGAIALNALPRIGQTIQFQIRDSQTARDDLQDALTRAAERIEPHQSPIATVLCASGERNDGSFGAENGDLAALAAYFPDMPVAGLACSGEIAPVGRRPFLHGFTAALGLITRVAD